MQLHLETPLNSIIFGDVGTFSISRMQKNLVLCWGEKTSVEKRTFSISRMQKNLVLCWGEKTSVWKTNALKAQYRLAPGIAGTHSFPRPDAVSLCLQISSDNDTPKLPFLKRTKKNQKRKQKERKKNATPSRHRYRQVATEVNLKN